MLTGRMPPPLPLTEPLFKSRSILSTCHTETSRGYSRTFPLATVAPLSLPLTASIIVTTFPGILLS